MNEELTRLYEEAMALIRLRNNGIGLFLDFKYNDDKKVMCVLKYLNNKDVRLKEIPFKYFDTPEVALRYFIKYSQNIYNLR